jgi:putative hydrolases of HD superfamily
MSNQALINNLFAFYIQAEKLKTTMRHSWTNEVTRQESSAEHSWMMCLIAMSVFEHLTVKVDQLRVLKILLVHDLAEAITGDIPSFEVSKRKELKSENEKIALETLTANLTPSFRQELLDLWNEYESKETIEAKIAHAIDKFESPLQHNISDITTWDQNDFDIHPFYKMEFAEIDPFLKDLRASLEDMSREKITDADSLDRIKPEVRAKYEELNKNEK